MRTSIFVFLILASSQAFASEFHWRISVGGKGAKSLGDEESKHAANEWTCIVEAPAKEPKSGHEFRMFKCSIGDSLATLAASRCSRDKKTKKIVGDAGSLMLETKEPGAFLGHVTVKVHCATDS